MKTNERLKLSDLSNRYVHMLFGLVAHLYIIFSSSIYFSLEHEFREHLGLEKETIVTYFCLFSIALLLVSLYLQWSWPIRVEEALIVIFLWILLGNLTARECVCCGGGGNEKMIPKSGPTVEHQAQAQQEASAAPGEAETVAVADRGGTTGCAWDKYDLIYSVLCALVMVSSFMMNAEHYAVSAFFTVLSIVLMILIPLVTISCNQFTFTDINLNLIKFALYIVIWYVNRRLRLTEIVLLNEYLRSIGILESYQHPLLREGHRRGGGKKAASPPPDYTIPANLFRELEDVNRRIAAHLHQQQEEQEGAQSRGAQKRARHEREEQERRVIALQLESMDKLCRISTRYREKRWSGSYFSWKNRFYDKSLLYILDLARTLWILVICPVYLFFIAFEFVLLLHNITWNIRELKSMIRVVKLMDFFYKKKTR